jgi:hypothetical protein
MALDEKTPFQLAIESELKKVHDALDDAWLARKSPAAPIALGILSVFARASISVDAACIDWVRESQSCQACLESC